MSESQFPTTPVKHAIFFRALAKVGNVSAAAREAGMDRRWVYTLREKDKAFAEAWDAAIEEVCDGLEAEAHRRAVQGVVKPLFHQGQPIYQYRTVTDDDGQPVKDGNGHDLREVVRDAQGQPVQAVEYTYSDALLMQQLKANLPWKYRESTSVELTGRGGGPLQVETTPLDSARKIAYALTLGLRAKALGATEVEPIEQLDDGSDLA